MLTVPSCHSDGGGGSERAPLIAPPDCKCAREREREREAGKRRQRVAQERWRDRLFAVISVFISSLVL